MMLSNINEFEYRIGFPLAAVGEVLTHPTKKTFELAAKMVRPLQPGTSDQWATKAREIVHRVLLAFAVLLTIPYHLTLGLLGFGLHVLTTPTRKKITLVNHAHVDNAPDKIKVCTFNTALLPDAINGIKGEDTDFGCFGSIPGSLEERVNNIAQAILKFDADVVCLQEVLDPRAARLLKDRLSQTYPHFAYNVNPQIIRFNSGLMTLSKYSINKAVFHEFDAKTGVDAFAGKGFLKVTLPQEDDQEIIVYNTHMNSDVGLNGRRASDSDPVRNSQLQSIYDDADEIPRHVICGDFNRYYYTEYSDKGYEGQENDLDYILSKASISKGSADPMGDSSDHDAVIATIDFSQT